MLVLLCRCNVNFQLRNNGLLVNCMVFFNKGMQINFMDFVFFVLIFHGHTRVSAHAHTTTLCHPTEEEAAQCRERS